MEGKFAPCLHNFPLLINVPERLYDTQKSIFNFKCFLGSQTVHCGEKIWSKRKGQRIEEREFLTWIFSLSLANLQNEYGTFQQATVPYFLLTSHHEWAQPTTLKV